MVGAALARPRSAAAVLLALAVLVALTGCSTQRTAGSVTVKGSTLTIYASSPPGGAGGTVVSDVLGAEQLALHLSGERVGRYALRLVALHGRELTANARAAVQDQSAIAYLGELAPGSSQDSVPITNELGLLQVSPVDTALYLTQPTAAVPGAPASYYPSSSTYHETFARVVPSAAQEAHAIVAEMGSLHVTRLSVSSDGSPYGASIADAVRTQAAAARLSFASGASGADAVFYGAMPGSAAVSALNAAAAASPSARLFAPSAMYDNATASQLSAAAQRNLLVSTPGFTAATLPSAGRGFVTAFSSAYGHAPAPQAIFGYEAMAAVIAVLKQAGANADSRATVVSDFRALHDRSSVLGTYSINGGDTSLAPFVFARVRGGQLAVPGA